MHLIAHLLLERVIDRDGWTPRGIQAENKYMLGKGKKRLKLEQLLHALGRYQYLLLALAGQLYVLLLISVSAELYGVLGIPHATVINALSLVSLVVMALLAMMQCTYPMTNELPIIVLLAWIMLSTQASSTYCLCCDHHHSTTIATTTTLGLPSSNATDNSTVPPAADTGGTNALTTTTSDDAAEHDNRLHSDGQYVLNAWLAHVHGCRRESLIWLYSALALVMLAASLLADLRYYYLAFMNRLVVVALIVVLLLLLVLSPGSCSQFNAADSFTLILRMTLYHLLWFMNQYKDVTELVLLVAYKQGLAFSELIAGRHKKKTTKKMSSGQQPDTPCGVMVALDANAARLRRYGDEEQHGVGGDVTIVVERAPTGGDTGEHLRALMTLLVDEGHQLYYSGAWLANTLSWKHRAYGRRLYQLIALARTVWVLVVSPWLMLPLVPLMAAWLLYHIGLNKVELRHACKHTGLIEFYLHREQQQQRHGEQ
jgi:hypothetical protein